MTNGNDLITPYAWMLGADGKTPVLNPNPNALTKREHFAAMAMQGLLSNSSAKIIEPITEKGLKSYCDDSVKLADALIKALNENKY